jgi:hypothetical protein
MYAEIMLLILGTIYFQNTIKYIIVCNFELLKALKLFRTHYLLYGVGHQ